MARGNNKAILIGNLARDPELRYTANKTPVASFAVAVNRTWKGANGEVREEVDFIPIVVWNKQAEFCERYLKKGSSILVEGRISVRSYEAKTGEKRYVTEVIAENIQFVGAPRRDGDSPDQSGAGRYQPQSQPRRDDAPRSYREEKQSDGGFSGAKGFDADSFPMDISELGSSSPAVPSDDEADIPF